MAFDPRGQFGAARGRAAAVEVPPRPEPPTADSGPVRAGGDMPSVFWVGHFAGYQGYAKANREIVHGLTGTFRVCVADALGRHEYDPYERARLDPYYRVAVPGDAPLVRFCGPGREAEGRFRVTYTMMETERVHPLMVEMMNRGYDECWTPCEWNAQVFRESGLSIPAKVMPLGVNPLVYRPDGPAFMPPCRLLTTDAAGKMERPQGFVFIYFFLPSFRKGVDVLLAAFERAFADDPEAALVLGVTHGEVYMRLIEADLAPGMMSRVYLLLGRYTEREMASIYRASSAYVCASRGEGYNLPACEAGACGLPLILPRNSCHTELFEGLAPLFDMEGSAPYPEADTVSPFYKEMPFPIMGRRSVDQLAEMMREARKGRGGPADTELSRIIRTERTWAAASSHVAERLLGLQPAPAKGS